MTFADALSLGRVSNLPTVWSNLVAAVVLSGASLGDVRVPLLAVALTAFYVAGMYLNDFFDADVDAVERPERPIPAGRVARATVGTAGFAMLIAGIALMSWMGLQSGSSPWPAFAAVALAACIVLYDCWHKDNPLSPLIMGACRVMVYVAVGLSVAGALPPALLTGAAVLLSYLVGLTYVAKQENLGRIANLWPLIFLAVPALYAVVLASDQPVVWPFLVVLVVWVLVALHFIRRRGPGDIPRAVVSLIAGISLLDGVLVAGTGSVVLAGVCVAGFALTLVLQRYVAGT